MTRSTHQVGRIWNELTFQQRVALLESAEYKPETIAKFAPLCWGQIDASSRINFGRIVAIEYVWKSPVDREFNREAMEAL